MSICARTRKECINAPDCRQNVSSVGSTSISTCRPPMNANDYRPLPTLNTIGGCPACGVQGIHSCLGHPIPHLTPEQTAAIAKLLGSFPAPQKVHDSIVHSDDKHDLKVFDLMANRAEAFLKIRALLQAKGFEGDGILARLRAIVESVE